MNLLSNSKASYSANSSLIGIDSRIILYDCFIGGAVTVGLSRAAHCMLFSKESIVVRKGHLFSAAVVNRRAVCVRSSYVDALKGVVRVA